MDTCWQPCSLYIVTALCEWTSQAELVRPRLLALGSSRAARSAPHCLGCVLMGTIDIWHCISLQKALCLMGMPMCTYSSKQSNALPLTDSDTVCMLPKCCVVQSQNPRTALSTAFVAPYKV